MKQNYLLSIKTEDRPGVLLLIIGMIAKKFIRIQSINAAPTDIHDIILIAVKITATEQDLTTMVLKLENIVEVLSVKASKYDRLVCLRAAYSKIDKSILGSPKAIALSTHDATIVRFYPDAILLAKYGTDQAIRKLYNALDGPHLLGFSQTALIAESNLISHDDIGRIIGLAA